MKKTNVRILSDLYDDNMSTAFDHLEREGRPVTPEEVSNYTGIPVDDVRMLMMLDRDLDGNIDDWSKVGSAITEAGTSDSLRTFRERASKLNTIDELANRALEGKGDLGALRALSDKIDPNSTLGEKVRQGIYRAESAPIRAVVSHFTSTYPTDTSGIRNKLANTDQIRQKLDEARNLISRMDSLGAVPSEYAADYNSLKDFVNNASGIVAEDTVNWNRSANSIMGQWMGEAKEHSRRIGRDPNTFEKEETTKWLSAKRDAYPPGSQERDVAEMLLKRWEELGGKNPGYLFKSLDTDIDTVRRGV